jgi:Pyruvate/2-oxoacid:ferredoxin oxidoreductase gamma subunit
VVILGSAGQRVITAGEILCLAGLSAGLKTTQKNDYDITVLRGPSISELILSPDDIDFTGIENPSAIIAISQEGADRRKGIFESLDANALVIKPPQVDLPASRAKTVQVDFKSQQIKPNDWALAALSVMAKMNKAIQNDMLRAALAFKFKNNILASALDLAERVKIS